MGKWTIVFALFLINFIDIGIIKSFSVLMGELVVDLDSDVETIGTILGSYHGLSSLLAPIITPILGYIPVKGIAFISVVGSLSLSLLSMISSAAVFAVLAFITGVSYAFVITSVVLRMCETVVEGFAVAYGIINAGTSVGMVVLPIFTEFLLEVYGWRGAVAILGAVSVHTSVLVLLLGEHPAKVNGDDHHQRRLDQDTPEVNPDTQNEESKLLSSSDMNQNESDLQLDTNVDSSMVRNQKRTKTSGSGCKNPWFSFTSGVKTLWTYLGLSLFMERPYALVFNLGFLVIGLVNTAWMVFLIPHGVSKGIPLSRAVFLALFGGIGQCIGRVGQGLIIDRNWLSAVELTINLSIISGLTFCLDPVFQQYEVLCVLAFLGGVANGGRVSLTVITLKQFIPSERFQEAYALDCFFYGIGEPLGGLVAGYIADAYNYEVAYVVLGSIDIALSITLIVTNYFITRNPNRYDSERRMTK